jgi:hypothetical protein
MTECLGKVSDDFPLMIRDKVLEFDILKESKVYFRLFYSLLSIRSALAFPIHGFLVGGFLVAQKPGGHDSTTNL